MTRIVAASDTHGRSPKKIPDGDVFVHAGDLTEVGKRDQVLAALDWIAATPHNARVVVAGNHDFWCEKHPDDMKAECADRDIAYLCRELEVVCGLAFWGSPWTPKFFDWAFMYSRGSHARSHWADVPEGLDVLVTHGPPFGMGDRAYGRSVGCVELLERLYALRQPPQLHLFGHIHCDRGTFRLGDDCPTVFANVATDYGKHPAVAFDVEARP